MTTARFSGRPAAPRPPYSCRRPFITSLERVAIRPKLAQTLVGHWDVRLTLGVHTHVDLPDQTAAIAALRGE